MSETIPAPSGAGTVMLDLGTGQDALILHTPADLDGREIEISLNGAPDARRTHSQVRERRAGSSVRYAAVYPDLPTGDYTVWRDADTPAARVTITDGQITGCRWPA
ncbi:MAG TPA: hypothetical protein VGL63_05390 [Streptosporangiaceae bacterium]